MPPLRDANMIAKFLEALKEWRHDGYIEWRPRARDWLSKNLQNHSQKAIGHAMYLHVVNGGKINQAKEPYEGYRDAHPYHYDFEFSVSGRAVYIETVFDDTIMGPTVTIVNIKDSKKQ
jgi:hypothetical protein